MEEFTGDYPQCQECKHIYDFNDRCPECGSEEIIDLNAKEVKRYSRDVNAKEQYRLSKMLETHGDL